MSAPIAASQLLDLIAGLDARHQSEHDYISVTRWSAEGGGTDDEQLEALVRQLARERLGAFPHADIGASVIAKIDRKDDA